MKETILAIDICSSKIATIIANIQDKNVDILGFSISNSFGIEKGFIIDIEEAYLNSFCKGYRVNQNKCNPYFLNYLLLSNIYRQRLIVEGKGFTRINLKMEKVTDFEIFLPPTLSEQKEIANYIDLKTTTIDAIVSNISKQIETLKQLRKTLINDVVTGKIKVVE